MKCPNCYVELKEIGNGALKCPNCIFITFPHKKIITEIAAIVSVDENGMEGLMAYNHGDLKMAMVSTDYNFLKTNFYPLMKKQMEATGIKIKIKRFGLIAEVY